MKYGDRSARARAKIKLLVDAWGAERVRAVFDEEFARAKLVHGDAIAPLAAGAPQPTGRASVPALIPMGELPVAAARALAAAATRFGEGVVHLTPDQNAEVHGVREANVAAVIALIRDAGLRTAGRGGITDVVSCVGLEYCPLAVTHAMTMGEELALAFVTRRDDPRYADFRMHVSGCPHSCAKHQVADIGLAGATTDHDGTRVEAYVLYVGGNARERRLGTTYAKKIPRSDVAHVVDALLAVYEEHALPGERFSATVARAGMDPFFRAVTAALANEQPSG